MLINIINATPEMVMNHQFSIAIENILRSFSERKHLVIANKNFFETIIHENDGIYSQSSKNIASNALSSLMEYRAILQMVSFHIDVDFEIQDSSFKWIDLGKNYKFSCGPLYFHDSGQLQKTKIVCENPSDSDFFKIIANFYAQNANLSQCAISFTAINGGGGSTKDTFERITINNEITYCIVDNDKKHPLAPSGGTSAQFGKFKFQSSGCVEILDVHEIESLIPLDTIENVLKELNLLEKRKDSLNFFKEICSINENTKFYFDHKKGFNLKSAIELDNKHGIFWKDVLSKINIGCDCIRLKKCDCSLSCKNYDGFGDNLLNNTLTYINTKNPKKYKPILTPILEEKWHYLGKSFFSWSCGPYKKSRVS
ncbi:hypothetical protein GKR71_15370 [Providencia sp. wls1922]|uniref:hypothetical protein n=1 Tax=Providencia sp. wls1922 TaxID=2675152 RepID=UPI0012B5A625|nr:hypothetical protein [Providencia sp. wls1922]MTC47208.1 hypothetical protein [Providencia sp. wls1922]